jgi:rubrerythrin
MLEDFDHLYRFTALMDRMTGQDSNNILQSYTDIRPGRPTLMEHRAPEDDVRRGYDRATASAISKLNALTIVSAEHQVHDYYMNIGPIFADPVARMLYAEIAAVEEQHVTHYECLIDPDETWLEKWLLHECNEVYTYWSCLEQESNGELKAIWERFLDYELGHLNVVMDLVRRIEKRDPEQLIPATLPSPIKYESQRDFIRDTLAKEVDLRTKGTEFVAIEAESPASLRYREQLNSEGSPSELVARDYQYTPGTELNRAAADAIH